MESKINLHEASYYVKYTDGKCTCQLCPRECKISKGKKGFCQTRQNIDGVLYAITYGKSLELTQEVIETEAVYHRDPGTPILSIGNIGCNLDCDFCQNWATSQMKYLKEEDYGEITPEKIVKEALRRNIQILSWTYNDPVVFQEFLVDTAREAKKYGLRNLYKSAFYINEKPIEELLEVIDIFSLSLKSIDEDFYTKYCHGSLRPILEGIKQVYKAGAYLEISNLVVTGRNDSIDHARKVADWVLTELDENVPLHFVAFHPAYKYAHTTRTSEVFLQQIRDVAISMGLKRVNIGNIFNANLATYRCQNCDEVTLKRYGLYTEFHHIAMNGKTYKCSACNSTLPIKRDVGNINSQPDLYQPDVSALQLLTYTWNLGKETIHLRGINHSDEVRYAFFQHKMGDGNLTPIKKIPLFPKESWRFLIQKETDSDQEVLLYHDVDVELHIMELLDRAYYPTLTPENQRQELFNIRENKAATNN
jgi:pyruvate formate lyase activating enzyme